MKRAIEETHGVKLLMGALRVAYRETITHELSVDYCMDKECTPPVLQRSVLPRALPRTLPRVRPPFALAWQQ